MNGRPAPIVALSVSDGPDLGRFGYLESHLRQVLGEGMVALLRDDWGDGWRIGYGGDLREGGYTRDLFEALSAAYARNRLLRSARPAIVHYFAFSSWRTTEPAALVRHLRELGTIAETRFCNAAGKYLAIFATEDGLRRIEPSSGETRSVRPADVIEQLASLRETAESAPQAAALSGMRKTMAAESVVRIVASGRVVPEKGRVTDPKEWMPGIVEEARLQAAAGRLVVALGAFGGASRDVAIALGMLPNKARVRYAEVSENYEPALAELAKLAEPHRWQAEKAGLWRELEMLAEADDPMAIAMGVLRVARGAAQTGELQVG